MKLNNAIAFLAVLSSSADHVSASGRRRRVIRGEEPRNPMIEHRELKSDSKSKSSSASSGSGRSSRSNSGDGDCGDNGVLFYCTGMCFDESDLYACMDYCCDNGGSSRSRSRSSRSRSSRSSSSPKSGGGGGGEKAPKGGRN